jgi:hypothetical protein
MALRRLGNSVEICRPRSFMRAVANIPPTPRQRASNKQTDPSTSLFLIARQF